METVMCDYVYLSISYAAVHAWMSIIYRQMGL